MQAVFKIFVDIILLRSYCDFLLQVGTSLSRLIEIKIFFFEIIKNIASGISVVPFDLVKYVHRTTIGDNTLLIL